LCQDPIDAKQCGTFSPKQTKADIWEELTVQLRDLTWLEANIPELFALLWILEAVHPPTVPFWKRALFWVRRIQLEPVLEPTPWLLEAPDARKDS